MKTAPKPLATVRSVSAIGMMLSLLWLTVSLPIVYSSHQKIQPQEIAGGVAIPFSDTEEENTNPFGNNTEEKAPNSSNSLEEEYMSHSNDFFLLMMLSGKHSKRTSESDYIAFHGELLSPPPEA